MAHTHLGKELIEYPHKVTKGQIVVCNYPLNLVKLSQVSCIQSLVPKHSIDGKVLDWCELLLLAELVEHASADGSGVSTKDVLLGLLQLPVILVPGGGGCAREVTKIIVILHRKKEKNTTCLKL